MYRRLAKQQNSFFMTFYEWATMSMQSPMPVKPTETAYSSPNKSPVFSTVDEPLLLNYDLLSMKYTRRW